MNINGSPEPKFETDKDCTYFLTVLRARVNDEHEALPNEGANVALSPIGKAQGKNEGANEGALSRIDDILGNVINAAFEGSTSNMKAKAKSLLNLMIKEEGKRAPEYAAQTGLSVSTVERYIRQLKRLGLVDFSNEPTKVGGYFITDKLTKQFEK